MTQYTESEIVKALEEQNKRREKLDSWRSKLEATIEHYQKEHEKLCKEAQEQFGTSDIDKLRKELLRRQQENKQALEKFKNDLNEQEKHLQSIQKIIDGVNEEDQG